MKKIAVLQSNYLPWKGVFDMISRVDEFVFLEDVQYTRRDWRNRNKMLTRDGAKWFVVPVKKAAFEEKIYQIEIANDEQWQKKHLLMFEHNYSRAPFFKDYYYILEELYINNSWSSLSKLNIFAIELICTCLNINTKFVNSIDLQINGTKDDKLIQICKTLNADHYISGPAAKNYIIPEKFIQSNISLEYIEYDYAEYKQVFEPFMHTITVLDVIFNTGPDAKDFICKR